MDTPQQPPKPAHPVLDRAVAGGKLAGALIRLAIWGTLTVIFLWVLIANILH